ncbi:helix-turn-helix domain-containing protein [Nocardia sp. NPDC050718]|uniref:AraC-like ligand-binding domain-containing protein n=1 Tax=Nocardia sp. NPDC050718 TaxID=3155788 RepID=UPI0033FB6875
MVGPAVASVDSFDEWEAVMSNAYVPVAVEPLPGMRSFRGTLTYGAVDGVEFSTLRSSGQRVTRTERLIARSSAEMLYVGICLSGAGRVRQDDRLAELRPGDMVFVDSRRPNWWESDGLFEQIVIQVPIPVLSERGGWTEPTTPAALTIAANSSAAVVTEYLRGVTALQSTHPAQAAQLAGHSIPLVASALAMAAGRLPGTAGAEALARQRVLAFMRHRCGDPALTVDDIARGCQLSRRALYRVFGSADGGVRARLSRMRIERAKALLRADPARPFGAVAAAAGFASERHFYRVFRVATGMTPGEFREKLQATPIVS